MQVSTLKDEKEKVKESHPVTKGGTPARHPLRVPGWGRHTYLLSKPQNILFASHSNTLLSQRTLLTSHIQSLLKFYNLCNILKFYNLYNILKLILENLKKIRKIKNEFRICKSRMFGYIRILKFGNLPMI